MEEVINQNVWICRYLLISCCAGSRQDSRSLLTSSKRWWKHAAFQSFALLLIPPCAASCVVSYGVASEALTESNVQCRNPAGGKLARSGSTNKVAHCPLLLRITRRAPQMEQCCLNWLENSVFSQTSASLLKQQRPFLQFRNLWMCSWGVWTITRNFSVCLQSRNDVHTIHHNELGEFENIFSQHARAREGRLSCPHFQGAAA